MIDKILDEYIETISYEDVKKIVFDKLDKRVNEQIAEYIQLGNFGLDHCNGDAGESKASRSLSRVIPELRQYIDSLDIVNIIKKDVSNEKINNCFKEYLNRKIEHKLRESCSRFADEQYARIIRDATVKLEESIEKKINDVGGNT